MISDLLYKSRNGYYFLQDDEEKQMESYCEEYKNFLNKGKTERECVAYAVECAEENGFIPFDPTKPLLPGDRIYFVNRNRSLYLAVIGQKSVSEGVNIGAAHFDSPHLDLRPLPLYEKGEMAFFRTHRYGHPREYQWVNIPLSMHGVVSMRNGSLINVCIGESDDDPQLFICDLLMHMGEVQDKKTLKEAITPENLNILVGGRPYRDSAEGDSVKLSVMRILSEKYGFTERDFLSADLEIVPAGKSRDAGIDRSFIASYGQDDRVCAFALLKSLFELKVPERTAVVICTDKEEVGSECTTGMQSECFDLFMEQICRLNNVSLKECYSRSLCLSADVTAGFDPHFANVFTEGNEFKMNHGVCIMKYSGRIGKSRGSEAEAELLGKIYGVLDSRSVIWQGGEFGLPAIAKSGTICEYFTRRNIDSIDVGVPLLSMHAPYEISAKLDCYMMYKCMKAIYQYEEG